MIHLNYRFEIIKEHSGLVFNLNPIFILQEGNIDNIGKFDRIKYALTLLDLEDELIIKYKESTDQDD